MGEVRHKKTKTKWEKEYEEQKYGEKTMYQSGVTMHLCLMHGFGSCRYIVDGEMRKNGTEFRLFAL